MPVLSDFYSLNLQKVRAKVVFPPSAGKHILVLSQSSFFAFGDNFLELSQKAFFSTPRVWKKSFFERAQKPIFAARQLVFVRVQKIIFSAGGREICFETAPKIFSGFRKRSFEGGPKNFGDSIKLFPDHSSLRNLSPKLTCLRAGLETIGLFHLVKCMLP